MIKFLLQRPIAVLMAFTACFIVGLVTYFTIPVSLLPDIAIPGDHRTGIRPEHFGTRIGKHSSKNHPPAINAGCQFTRHPQ